MKSMKRQITALAVIGILVVIFGTMYAVVQQAQRSDANYPQIQMSEDMAAQINGSADPHIASTLSPVDMAASLAPFTIIYDAKGDVVSGSGYLHGKVPKVPLGLLSASRGETFNAVTWQPQKGVRVATVTVATKNYYVMSGRSLKEVEKNEDRTLVISLVGGVLSLLVFGAAIAARMLDVETAPGRRL